MAYFCWRLIKGGLYSTTLLSFFVLTNRSQGFFAYLPQCQLRMRRIFAGVYSRVALTQELNYIEKRTWLTNFPGKDLQEAR